MIKEKINPPSKIRDSRLQEAIDILTQATSKNRGLWRDILSARSMLTETPRSNLLSAITKTPSDSFTSKQIGALLRTHLKQYLKAKSHLAKIKDQAHFTAQFQLFKKTEQPNLQNMLVEAHNIANYANTIKTGVAHYIQRLQDLRTDYESAQQEGFFATGSAFHGSNLKLIKGRIVKLKTLQKTINEFSDQLNSASQTHIALAEQELLSLKQEKKILEKDISSIKAKDHKIKYPKAQTSRLNNKLQQLLNFELKFQD